MTAAPGRVLLLGLFLLTAAGLFPGPRAAGAAEEAALRKAVTFYASFDEAVRGDFGGGDLTVFTGVRPSSDPARAAPVPKRGCDPKVFTIAPDKGVAGGCLRVGDVLPRDGRIFFAARGNLAFKKGGWGGAVSVWVKTDPDRLLKTKFCDPVQITEKGANNGGIWIDFNDARPRGLRHGAFPAVRKGQTAIKEEDPRAPMVRVPRVGFRAGDWHHLVLSWKNFDTGRKDAISALYIDGKRVGEVKDVALAMNWDLDKAGIYVAVNYIGLLDEFAVFGRPLSSGEVQLLRDKPGLLAALKPAR